MGTWAHTLAEVLTLHAEFLATASQDVLAGRAGTLGPGVALRGGARHVSALTGSQLLFGSFCFMKSLSLGFDETLLTVAFKRGASKGATLSP